jgi:hypothetical protein
MYGDAAFSGDSLKNGDVGGLTQSRAETTGEKLVSLYFPVVMYEDS